MKKITYTALLFMSFVMVFFCGTSCSNTETYADQKKKEKKSINSFINDNDVVGPIKVISEEQFVAQDSTTDVSKNEFVLFASDGVYMQIVDKGEGQTFPEMSKQYTDSTVSCTVLCRFMEYNIQTGDTTLANNFVYPLRVDKMLVTYSHQSRSYQGSFTEGFMIQQYSQAVPDGWLKPLDFIRMSRDIDKRAHVRIIVPHSEGTSTASNNVYPFYYDITYQLGRY